MFKGLGTWLSRGWMASQRLAHRTRISFFDTWKRLPILGHLVYCSKRNHADAAKELFVTLLFSTATFWMTVFLLKAYAANSSTPYLDLLIQAVSSGQLFIFAVTFLGPVYLIAGEDPANAKVFPNRGLHLVLIFPLALLGGGLYALQFGARTYPGFFSLNTEYLLHTSELIALLAVLLRYLTVVYRKSTLVFNPEVELVEPAQNFAEQFAARHQS